MKGLSNSDLGWFNGGDCAYLVSVSNLASAIIRSESSGYQITESEIRKAIKLADSALSKEVRGENEV